jgi:uncharacterized alkaline shock family protein YloU
MPDHRVPGRSIVTRRAIVDIVRPAVSGSYGVLGFTQPNRWKRLLRISGGSDAGIRISLRGGISIDLHLAVAYGLPVAEVARQADSAVRYALRRALGLEVARLTVHVGGLRFQPAPPVIAPVDDVASGPDANAPLADTIASRNGHASSDGGRGRRRRSKETPLLGANDAGQEIAADGPSSGPPA